MARHGHRFFFFPIFLAVFIDFLGLALVVPIFAPMMLTPGDEAFPQLVGLELRGTILGILTALFPLGQFIGAPVLGKLSDKYGRRPWMLYSLLLTIVGYLLSGFGILADSLTLLFVGRILCGIGGGNTSIAQSVVGDTADTKSKAAYFGYLSLAMGMGFIIGPIVGGRLADPSIVSWFNFDTPFWFAAIITVINVISVYFFFNETHPVDQVSKNIRAFIGWHEIKFALHLQGLMMALAIFFFFVTSWFFFAVFFQVYLIRMFDYNTTNIGDTYTYIGAFFALFQGLLSPWISRHFQARFIVRVSLLVLTVMMFLLLIPKSSFPLFFIYPFIALFVSLAWPNILSVISNIAGKDHQGEILGISQAVQSVAQTITPLVSGPLIGVDVTAPPIVGGICMGVGWLLAIAARIRRQKSTAPPQAQ